jgi:hypothetical protein
MGRGAGGYSEYSAAATLSPFLELAGLGLLAFAAAVVPDWSAVPGAAFASLLLVPAVSAPFGVALWRVLASSGSSAAAAVGVSAAHFAMESATLGASATCVAALIWYVGDAPSDADARAATLLALAGALEALGALYGIAVFALVLRARRAPAGAEL